MYTEIKPCIKCGGKNIFAKNLCSMCYRREYYKKNREKCIEYQKRYNKTTKGKEKSLLHKKKRDRTSKKNQDEMIFDKVLNTKIKKGSLYCRKSNLKKMGVKYEDFLIRIKSQKYRCEICKIRFKKEILKLANQDHCHKKNKIRGILCTKCNLLIGKGNDDINYFKKIIKYLEKYQ